MRYLKKAPALLLMLLGILCMFATPAFAWHITDASAHCDQGNHDQQGLFLHVQIKLSDKGPGTYSDSSGNSGTFAGVKNIEYDTPTFSIPLTVHIVWATNETSDATITSASNCDPPPTATTTTEVTTTTVAPTTTTTEAPSTSTTSTSTTVPETSTTLAPTTTTQPPETTTTVATTSTTEVTTTSAPSPTTTIGHPSHRSTSTTGPVSVPSSTSPAGPAEPLPFTGSSSRPLVGLGLALLVLGGALLLTTRRRRPTGT